MTATVRILAIIGGLSALWQCTAGGLAPEARFNHGMEIVNGNVCVYGGKNQSAPVELNSFLTDFRCADLTKGVDSQNVEWNQLNSASRFVMPPMAQHTSVYSRKNHIIYPYGGQIPMELTPVIRVSVFCTEFLAWGQSVAERNQPVRYTHTAVLQEASSDVIIFGGASDSTTGGEMRRWANPMRVVLNPAQHSEHSERIGRGKEEVPVGTALTDDDSSTPDNLKMLNQHTAALVNDTQMVVLGGEWWSVEDNKSVPSGFDHAYVYDVDKRTWRTHRCNGAIPSSRRAPGSVLHGNSIYVFGGASVVDWMPCKDQFYRLDLDTWTWTNLSHIAGPEPRYAHQMRVVGHYIIITHGFIKGTHGDPNIYFFDMRTERFVRHYTPAGISSADLDIEWKDKESARTIGVISVASLLLLCTAALSAHHLRVGIRQMYRPNPRRRLSGVTGRIRTTVTSYAETLRASIYQIAGSADDIESIESQVNKMHGAYDERPQTSVMFSLATLTSQKPRESTSDGSKTVIGSDSATKGAEDLMRHTRIMEMHEGGGVASSGEAYVTRRLTLSARLPVYKAPRLRTKTSSSARNTDSDVSESESEYSGFEGGGDERTAQSAEGKGDGGRVTPDAAAFSGIELRIINNDGGSDSSSA